MSSTSSSSEHSRGSVEFSFTYPSLPALSRSYSTLDEAVPTAVATAAPSRVGTPLPRRPGTEHDSPLPLPGHGHTHGPTMVEEPAAFPQATITFLLATSGARKTLSFDADTTVAFVKEFVWNTWTADWQEERPPAPDYLRILHMGRMLRDEDKMMDLNLPMSHPAFAPPVPTIMHLSIRTGPPSAAKYRKRHSTSPQGTDDYSGPWGWCGCVIS